jgi:hypothetical protein
VKALIAFNREIEKFFLINDISSFLIYIAPKYGRIMLRWGNRSTVGKTCPSAILSATNSTQNVLEMN